MNKMKSTSLIAVQESFHRILITRINERGQTQTALSTHLGISQARVSNLINRTGPSFSLGTLLQYLEDLDVVFQLKEFPDDSESLARLTISK